MEAQNDIEYAKALDLQKQYPPEYQQEQEPQQQQQQNPQQLLYQYPQPPEQQIPQQQQYPDNQQMAQQQYPVVVPPGPQAQPYPYQQFPQQYPVNQIVANQIPSQQMLIVQQGQQQQDLGPQIWKNSLCGCTKDCPLCCISFWCSCLLLYYHSTAVEKATKGESTCILAFLLDCIGCCFFNRQAIREAYKIQGNLFEDCCTSFWCAFCALMQEVNEVEERERG